MPTFEDIRLWQRRNDPDFYLISDPTRRLLFRMAWQRGYVVLSLTGEKPFRQIRAQWPSGSEELIIDEQSLQGDLFAVAHAQVNNFCEVIAERLYMLVMGDRY